MSTTTVNEMKVGILFEDGTVRNYTLEIDAADRAGVKAKVKEINNQTGTGAMYTAAMKQTFVSNSGSPMLKIATASVIETTEEVVYNG